MTPMRETIHRKRLQRAIDAQQAQVEAVVFALLDKRYKALKRELRQANLRKRLHKVVTPGADMALQQQQVAGALFKDGWRDWIETFAQGVQQVLTPVVTAVQQVETEYWASYNQQLTAQPPEQVMADAQARDGLSVGDIPEGTRSDVISAITTWFNGDGSLPDLIGQLGQFFSRARAAVIAVTEMVRAGVQVMVNAMHQFGVVEWNFDLAPENGPYPCDQCVAYANANPHKLGDPFPPLHPSDRCGVVYVLGRQA